MYTIKTTGYKITNSVPVLRNNLLNDGSIFAGLEISYIEHMAVCTKCYSRAFPLLNILKINFLYQT